MHRQQERVSNEFAKSRLKAEIAVKVFDVSPPQKQDRISDNEAFDWDDIMDRADRNHDEEVVEEAEIQEREALYAGQETLKEIKV